MRDAYAEAWSARDDLDPEPRGSGPSGEYDRYLTLLVDVDGDPVREALDAVAAELDGSGSLRRVPPDWFHAAVTELGSVVDDRTGSANSRRRRPTGSKPGSAGSSRTPPSARSTWRSPG
jgi:hypothetical protein